jgi:hypothetical protein
MLRVYTAFVLASLAWSLICVGGAAVRAAPEDDASATRAGVPSGRDFGAGLTLTETTSLDAIVRAPEAHTDRPALVRGRLADVCQKKGCWTILRDAGAQVRVTFKDYGFFLPTDAIGADAYVEGVVEVVTLSVNEARHYASESRDGDPEAIGSPVREVSIVASGVRLLPRPEESEE